MHVRLVSFLCLAAGPLLAQNARPPREEPAEIPIEVPSPIPRGVLIAWRPTILSVRIDSGVGSQFGSDKVQPLRFLARYTTTLFLDKLFGRAELEGGRFETDTQGVNLGTDGWDFTARLLGGTAARITPAFTATAGAGLLTRYQRGRAVGGAPRVGFFGFTSNVEFAYKVAPIITAALFFEGGLAPIPYGAEPRLGNLSDASELRTRLQVSFDLTASSAVDLGYEFTRWHAAFSRSSAFGGSADAALLIEAREHAITLGYRFKP